MLPSVAGKQSAFLNTILTVVIIADTGCIWQLAYCRRNHKAGLKKPGGFLVKWFDGLWVPASALQRNPKWRIRIE